MAKDTPKDTSKIGQKSSKMPPKAPLKELPKTPAKEQLQLPLKPVVPKRKKKKINPAQETKQFLTVLAVCTLVFTLLLYLIFMKSAR